ncbi:DNA-binding protein [Myroides pelagicus]|uniref:DNA-binding protein n=1 Tax=Myroides pelagicus TaxID=270914 RepID=UPI002DB589CF|nr:DNA-binding protein [Myroides pelagicus]MEC4115139.1 DNA-binding protein [Myroides pelagicus]
MKDLTNSSIERKNILNNNQAIEEIYINLGFYGLMFENKYRFTKSQVAQYFDVDTRTIDRILENNKEELIYSGYEVYNGVKLKQFKDHILSFLAKEDGNDIDVVTIKQIYGNEIDSLNKTSILGTFTYKAFLNIGMLLTDSENAQRLRSIILDIVIDFLNKKLGGKTKFINQREEDFISSAIREYNYRQVFTNYLDYYITDNKFKYAQLTDKIYKSLFKENANEYRQILNLKSKDSVRSTLYSEVLDLIASYENGFSDYLKRESTKLNRKLSLSEAHLLFNEYEGIMNSTLLPLKEKARSLMASRDLVFRDALHEKLKEYISEVSVEDFEKFLGENSKSLEERIEENKEVFIRLKDR